MWNLQGKPRGGRERSTTQSHGLRWDLCLWTPFLVLTHIGAGYPMERGLSSRPARGPRVHSQPSTDSQPVLAHREDGPAAFPDRQGALPAALFHPTPVHPRAQPGPDVRIYDASTGKLIRKGAAGPGPPGSLQVHAEHSSFRYIQLGSPQWAGVGVCGGFWAAPGSGLNSAAWLWALAASMELTPHPQLPHPSSTSSALSGPKLEQTSLQFSLSPGVGDPLTRAHCCLHVPSRLPPSG